MLIFFLKIQWLIFLFVTKDFYEKRYKNFNHQEFKFLIRQVDKFPEMLIKSTGFKLQNFVSVANLHHRLL